MSLRLLAVSGSLRAASSNSRAIEALARLAPAGVEVEIYRGIGELPFFNLDLDGETPPAAVRHWRERVGAHDGLIICSPEYAHGVAGAMKNALDWLVPSLEFPEKPVALVNASPGARFAQAHMRETLTVMSARMVDEACLAIPLQGRNLTVEQMVADPEVAGLLGAVIAALARAIDSDAEAGAG